MKKSVKTAVHAKKTYISQCNNQRRKAKRNCRKGEDKSPPEEIPTGGKKCHGESHKSRHSKRHGGNFQREQVYAKNTVQTSSKSLAE